MGGKDLAEDLARTLSVILLTLAEFEYAMSLVCGDFTSALVKHDPGAGMSRMNSGGGLGLRIEGQVSGLIKEVQEEGLWFPKLELRLCLEREEGNLDQ